MLSKCHQIFSNQHKHITVCTWMNLHMPIHQKSRENFDFVVIAVIYFVLPLPWRSQSPFAQHPATKAMCLLLTKRGPVGSRMGCVPQGGLCRVEESKLGAFLSVLSLGRNSGADLSPRCSSSGSDQGASQQSSSVHDWESCSVPVSFSYQHTLSQTHLPALAAKGPLPAHIFGIV